MGLYMGGTCQELGLSVNSPDPRCGYLIDLPVEEVDGCIVNLKLTSSILGEPGALASKWKGASAITCRIRRT